MKAGIAQRLVLVQRQADVVVGGFVKVRAKQAAIFDLPSLVGRAECDVKRVRREAAVGLSQRVVPITGPVLVCGIGHHRRPYRIQFNVALASQQIGVGLHDRGLVAAVP